MKNLTKITLVALRAHRDLIDLIIDAHLSQNQRETALENEPENEPESKSENEPEIESNECLRQLAESATKLEALVDETASLIAETKVPSAKNKDGEPSKEDISRDATRLALFHATTDPDEQALESENFDIVTASKRRPKKLEILTIYEDKELLRTYLVSDYNLVLLALLDAISMAPAPVPDKINLESITVSSASKSRAKNLVFRRIPEDTNLADAPRGSITKKVIECSIGGQDYHYPKFFKYNNQDYVLVGNLPSIQRIKVAKNLIKAANDVGLKIVTQLKFV